ncbi:hypothetical protein JAAARDRAFT_38117 [Jaapia argillacea MUCL 33604]|uniref:Vps72/YL1 C-terminal domain-containing protein n=1 Tax=Jaapia argillacea MUCL 33604 TaxID=933084 RepID=A0A067PMH5_9AGAM|nr:hypothetical protein JAAARDRAFT_38117 [Jaapia argillacea MUCL 33604]
MADEEDSLVRRRSRRSTAGNRMEAALAEMVEELAQEVEEDVDFVIDKDEDDVFESDFESTDEETANQGDPEASEKAIVDEEKRDRKAARSRAERAVAGAHARQKVTFNPQVLPSSVTVPTSTPKPKRRVSLGVAVNAETGEVVEGTKGQRQSKRTSTILNRSATETRIKDAEEKRAVIPKKTKTYIRAPTQDELIARALDMEEGNISEHRNYLSLEEEKRKRARVVRASVEGPLLRWLSRGEEVQVQVDPPATHPSNMAASYPYMHANTSSHGTYPAGQPWANPPAFQNHTLGSNTSHTPTPTSTPGAAHHLQYQYTYAQYYPPPPPPPPPEPTYVTSKVTKNYVIHELGQETWAPKPGWTDTMRAMFGDDIHWEELKVYLAKGRPLTRPVQLCPITGLPARYKDPRSGVPYANARAFEVLTGILNHEFIWSDTLHCYIGREGEPTAMDVDDG